MIKFNKVLMIIIILFYLISNYLSSEASYIVQKDLNVYDVAGVKIGKVKKGEKYKIFGCGENILKIDNEYGVNAVIEFNEKKDKGIVNSSYLIPEKSDRFEDYRTRWFPNYYIEAYNKKDKDIIYMNQIKYKEEVSRRFFWGSFLPTTFFITNSIIVYKYNDMAYVCQIEKIKKIDKNNYLVKGKDVLGKIFRREENMEIKIKIQNNKLNVSTNWEILEKEFEKVDDSFIEKFDKFTEEPNELHSGFFTSTISNLRLRDTIGNEGKVIRLLAKGEKVELIEVGNSEIINGVKGNWIKIRTEQGEVGWCFDAYLKEVK